MHVRRVHEFTHMFLTLEHVTQVATTGIFIAVVSKDHLQSKQRSCYTLVHTHPHTNTNTQKHIWKKEKW